MERDPNPVLLIAPDDYHGLHTVVGHAISHGEPVLLVMDGLPPPPPLPTLSAAAFDLLLNLVDEVPVKKRHEAGTISGLPRNRKERRAIAKGKMR